MSSAHSAVVSDTKHPVVILSIQTSAASGRLAPVIWISVVKCGKYFGIKYSVVCAVSHC